MYLQGNFPGLFVCKCTWTLSNHHFDLISLLHTGHVYFPFSDFFESFFMKLDVILGDSSVEWDSTPTLEDSTISDFEEVMKGGKDWVDTKSGGSMFILLFTELTGLSTKEKFVHNEL